MTRRARPGGFWRRGVALAIDGIWLFALAGSLSTVLFGIPLPSAAGDGVTGAGVRILHYLMPAIVVITGWWQFGTTPGKFLVDLRVVDHRTGCRAGLARLVVRYAGYFLSALPLGLGFVLAGLHRDRRALHDLVAGTRVVMVEEADLDLTLGGTRP